MTQHLTADDAAALLLPRDSLGMPLGPGQPPAFLEALGRRTFDGMSVATFAAGSRELYDWLHENHEVAFLPVAAVPAVHHHRRR